MRHAYTSEHVRPLEEGGYNVHYHAYPGDHEWNVWRKCARDFAMEILSKTQTRYLRVDGDF